MNNAEFYARTDEFYRELVKIMQSKGSEYSGSEQAKKRGGPNGKVQT